jgi:Kef-type K+ transport system membrane component KefB
VAIIVIAARIVGSLFRRIRQPAVVGEILAGILLGPTLLGAFPGHLTERFFPGYVRPFLSTVANLGLIIFMFIVGLELDLNLIKGKERVAAVVSISSIILPFGLGFLLASHLHHAHGTVAGHPVRFLPFAMFIGASMSVTAFPVLARILTERGMYKTEVGTLSLACAAVDDIMAWSLLAVVLAVVKSSGALNLPKILLESVAFTAVMFLLVKPWLGRLADRYRRIGKLTPEMMAVVLVGILASSYTTSKIGIHSIFGAFVFGAVMPRQNTAPLFHAILGRLEDVTVLLLLPVFFIATGLGVNVRGIGLSGLGDLGLILLVACAGKFIGASVAAKAQGIPTRRATVLGTLMNTRGLTELVILNVGKEFGVLDGQLFTLLVVMAVVTTIITEPILRILYPPAEQARDIAKAAEASVGLSSEYRVLLAVGNPRFGAHLVDAALDLIGDESPAELVLTRFVPLPTGGEIRTGLYAEQADEAEVTGALNALKQRAEERGVRTVTLSQLSRDFANDLIAQATATNADLIVLGWNEGDEPDPAVRDFVRKVLREALADVVIVVDPDRSGISAGPGRPVVVAAGEGYHNPAALEAAVRLARSKNAEVALVDVTPERESASGEASQRLNAIAEEIQKTGLSCEPFLAPDGVTAEVVRRAPQAGLIAAGLDEEWYSEKGTFGAGTDELLARVRTPVLLARARQGITKTGIGGFLERVQGRGLQDRSDIAARLQAAGPEQTHGGEGPAH